MAKIEKPVGMQNGCLCCLLDEEVEMLAEKRDIDYIVIEYCGTSKFIPLFNHLHKLSGYPMAGCMWESILAI